MTKEELEEIMDELGMINENDVIFPKTKRYSSVVKFVNGLALYNDLETIKQLLVAIIMEVK